MTFRTTLNREYPEAMPVGTYLDRVNAAIQPLEFSLERTLAAVSVCRDELTQHFTEQIADRWGRPFTLGGLGALPSLGRTGWGAALSHVPQGEGRGHLVVFGLPHIGIDPDGILGQSLRRHQDGPTATCGAMVALLNTLRHGAEPVPAGLDDREAERLRELISVGADTVPLNLGDLVRLAVTVVETEMWAELEALEAWRTMDVAVFCGIQIHLPDQPDHIWPSNASVQGADGNRRPLNL